ncbi:hypothetical protein MIND_01095100 [Mycena indigotica]|uniref:Aldehyde dehydrogenase n=1 Tax=Mycena indigotica TaxID=2126181 RepID=A0A8H6S9N9_9AGAR|nr:uncharacterized protein MIND_01095100 [Mycena indigotica]KAF7295551.1 hypothetical protein MIND_01095100 [Mycena indigotica]
MATTTPFAYTSLEEIEQIHAELKAGFKTGQTKSIAFRKYQLLQLAYLLQDNAKALEEALTKDLGRPPLESVMMEIGASISELMEAYKNVDKWAAPEKPSRTLNFMFMNPVTYKEPKGVVLIISPFNYPLWLIMSPLAGAIAAGNTVVIKPAEGCPAIAALLTEQLPKYIDPSFIRIVNGSVAETTKLLDLPWGHILYTGSGRVGKIVAAAAVKHLTPVTLELGGKCPVFIDPASDLKLAAKRIVWGKFTNAGQTCVAPDYILVPKEAQEKFVKELKTVYAEFYPETAESPPRPAQNTSKMINQAAWKRVNGLLQASKGTIVCGGEGADEDKKFIPPTILQDVTFEDSLMSEEIFGPVLPIIPVENLDTGIAYVNANDHPLALYVFTQNDALKKKIFSSTLSGSAVANETIIIPGVSGLPFGGVGGSGYGGYHTGKYGFEIFTHLRASIDTPSWIDKLLGVRYPPYTDKNLDFIKKNLSQKLPSRPRAPPSGTTASSGARKWFLLALAVAVVGALTRMKSRVGAIRA